MHAGVSFSGDAAADAAAASAAVSSWGGGVEVHGLGLPAKAAYRQQLEAASRQAETGARAR